MPSPPAVLAVDGGATKTDAVLLDATGTVLGRARGPGSNHQMDGLDTAMAHLGTTIRAVAAEAGLDPAPCPVAPRGAYCLAGIDLPVDERRVSATVAQQGWTTDCDVRNDTLAVLRAGVTSGWGVAVVCGTGLNCAGLRPDGTSVRFPALGELSGDFAPGGIWLGVRGLGLALRAGDGRGARTVLEASVPEHFAAASPEAVLEAVYSGQLSYGRLPELAELVLDAAAGGDGPASEAVDQLADEVVTIAAAAIRRLDVGPAPVEVVVAGGIFEHEHFCQRVLHGMQACEPAAALRPLSGPPVLGAALLGLDAIAAGPEAEAAVRNAMEQQ